jgi:hypothetical protein
MVDGGDQLVLEPATENGDRSLVAIDHAGCAHQGEDVCRVIEMCDEIDDTLFAPAPQYDADLPEIELPEAGGHGVEKIAVAILAFLQPLQNVAFARLDLAHGNSLTALLFL